MQQRLKVGIGICVALLAFGCGAAGTSTAPSPTPTPTPNSGNPVVDQMLSGLTVEIASALAANQQSLPNNPGAATQIQAKIALLQRPTLANEIITGGFYVTASAMSISGGTITIAAVFPTASMRSDASTGVQQLATALPILEQFMGGAFPFSTVRMWYGFVVGSSDNPGSGVINAEDQATYESRTPASRLPLEAILDHELSHNYIPHEGLNIFLEVYQFNVVHTNSTDPALWIYARTNVSPPPDSVASSDALLNVYRLIGRDAMARAYRTIYPLNPPYGQALSAACKQAFIDQAPPGVKAQVTALINDVVF
jgi:hypothetical protein